MLLKILSYLGVLIITLSSYLIIKISQKETKNKLLIIQNSTLIATLITYFYILSSIYTRYYYDISSLKAVLIITSLCIMLFISGVINNKEKTYQKNIAYYLIFYLILLISITIFIGRGDIDINFKNLNYLIKDCLIPFKTIKKYLRSNVLLKTKLYNLGGNFIMLIPFSFLLMLKNDKYQKILTQVKIILPIIIFIEFLQLLTGTGTFEIDDIILNFGGVLIFSFLITRFNFIGKIKKLFYSDFKLPKKIKYLLFYISLIIPSIFVIKTIIISLNYLLK